RLSSRGCCWSLLRITRCSQSARGNNEGNLDRSAVPLVKNRFPRFHGGVRNEKGVGREGYDLLCFGDNFARPNDLRTSIPGLGTVGKNACRKRLRAEARRADSREA